MMMRGHISNRLCQEELDLIDMAAESRCPACGDLLDYCQGHGAIGDIQGHIILNDHDLGQHVACHPYGCEYAPQGRKRNVLRA